MSRGHITLSQVVSPFFPQMQLLHLSIKDSPTLQCLSVSLASCLLGGHGRQTTRQEERRRSRRSVVILKSQNWLHLATSTRWSLYWYLDVCDDHRFPNSLAVKAIKNFLLIPSFYSWSTYGARCSKLLKRDISYHIPRILSSLTNDSPFCCDAMLPMEHWTELCQNQNKSLISPMRWF